jgi:hypothetical protein
MVSVSKERGAASAKERASRSVRDPSHRSAGLTNGDKLSALQKLFPNKSGLRLRASSEKSNRNARAATLWLYLESRGEYELHETVFAKHGSQSNAWWTRYFSSKVFRGTGKNTDAPNKRLGVLDGAIIPGVNRKTRRQWTVRAVIGYCLHDNVNALYSGLHSQRNQAKR